jgi:hypothetical protein
MDGWANLQLAYIMASAGAKAKSHEIGSSLTGIPERRRRQRNLSDASYMGRKLGVRLYWMWRNGCAYSSSLEFGSYVGQLGTGHGEQ